MLVKNQKVIMRWNGRNKKHFIDKGYLFTKLNDEIEVNVEHLTKGSSTIIKVICDYCFKEKETLYNQYYEQVIKPNFDKYCCKECIGKRISENHSNQLKGLRLHRHCDTNTLEGIIYGISDDANSLSPIQKILINEIQRYCEENKKFPNEKDMSNKKGYVSRTQFYKLLDIDVFTEVHKYIYPLEETIPKYKTCTKCNITKNLNEENFIKDHNGKFGFMSRCRECINKYSNLLNYKKKGIVFNNFSDIEPEQWWEYLYEGKIGYLPDFCLEEENIIKITRYILLIKFRMDKKQISKLTTKELKKYKIYHFYNRYHNLFDFLNLCFPEMLFTSLDMTVSRNTSDEEIITFISKWIKDNEYTIEDLLDCNFSYDNNKKLTSLVTHKFCSFVDMLCWYFNKANILHPSEHRLIDEFDFKIKPNHFWASRENRNNAVRKYCSINGIEEVINDTNRFKKWLYKYFKQSDINKVVDYGKYYNNLYEVLIEAYPEIRDNHLLFEWEWHQCNKNEKDFLIRALRELLLYRENKNSPEEISRFLNHTTLVGNGYTKFTKHVQRGRFSNYYEWASLSFPEFKDSWKLEDFYKFIAKDGSVCDSLEEVKIYEFIKYELGIDNINAIGTSYKGDFAFVLPKHSKDKWYCPDFIIKSDEPIFIEYFGLYTDTPPKNNKLLNVYKNKTIRKIDYYNTQAYTFIYLFPNDIKDSFKGVVEKLKYKNVI
jgi:hypothetical protein